VPVFSFENQLIMRFFPLFFCNGVGESTMKKAAYPQTTGNPVSPF